MAPARRQQNASGAGSAGRVIAGTARGRPLVAPGDATRPLGDRVKQTLFAILEPEIRGRAFLDLFAGSGAAGIEALSRGAARAVFVERDAGAVRTIGANLAATGLAGDRAVVRREEVASWLGDATTAPATARAAGPFAVVVVDPPYDSPVQLVDALQRIAAPGPDAILAKDGVVVAKHFWKAELPARIGLLRSVRERRFGETMLTFLRWAEEEDR